MPIVVPPRKTFADFEATVLKGDALVRVVEVDSKLRNLPSPDNKFNDKLAVELEFEQLADPKHTRPIFRTGNSIADRAFVKDLSRGNRVIHRGIEPDVALNAQAPITANPDPNTYYDVAGNPIPRPVHNTRGADKNTIFTKKRSCDLLDKRFRFVPFGGNHRPKLIGFCFDDAKVHKKNDKYCWKNNASSNERFWVGNGGGVGFFPYYISPDNLKADINAAGVVARYTNSELLRGFSANALTALFCLKSPGRGYLPGDRLTLLSYYINELAVQNPRRRLANLSFEIPIVPLVMLDGNGEHLEYTDAEILSELENAYNNPMAPIRAQRLREICTYLKIVRGGQTALQLANEILTAYKGFTNVLPAPAPVIVVPPVNNALHLQQEAARRLQEETAARNQFGTIEAAIIVLIRNQGYFNAIQNIAPNTPINDILDRISQNIIPAQQLATIPGGSQQFNNIVTNAGTLRALFNGYQQAFGAAHQPIMADIQNTFKQHLITAINNERQRLAQEALRRLQEETADSEIDFAGGQAIDVTAVDALKSLIVGGQPEIRVNNNQYRLTEQRIIRYIERRRILIHEAEHQHQITETPQAATPSQNLIGVARMRRR